MLIPVALACVALLLCLTILRQARGRVRIRRALQADGYQIYRMESRFFTRGPFHEMRRLPGSRGGDALYRVLALDAAGASHVLWARLLRGAPWQPPHFQLREDHAAHTKPGLSAAWFYGILFTVALALLLLSAF